MEPIDIRPLIRRRPRKQTGQRIETDAAFFVRYYVNGKRKSVKIADKSAQHRTWADVEHLVAALLKHSQDDTTPKIHTVQSFVETFYLPWVNQHKAPSTAYGYEKVWRKWKTSGIGGKILATLQTSDVSAVLTSMAQAGLSAATLGHTKWFLSGVYDYAVKTGIVKENPAADAGWLCKVARKEKQPEYSLSDVTAMLRVLEPVDIRAAVAVALAYFAALRPAEIRGLRWEDYEGTHLHIRRSYWRNVPGDTKTPESADSVPMAFATLRDILERLRKLTGGQAGTYILANEQHKPVSLDSLNVRVIAPTLKASGIAWHGYYPCRRGISSLITKITGSPMVASRFLRHRNLLTTIGFYTQVQMDALIAGLAAVEVKAEAEKGGTKETLQ
jgi:integrase